MAASLILNGTQTLVPAGMNINASNDDKFFQSEMSMAINPVNPLNVVAFSAQHGTIDIGLYFSNDGGVHWKPTRINNVVDGLPAGDRFDPSVEFDANGNLYVAYGFQDLATNTTNLVVARSQNGGDSFNQFSVVDRQTNFVDSQMNNILGVDKWHIATGVDPSTGNEAVYVAYTQNVQESTAPNVLGRDARIVVVGSNDGGINFTAPLIINDSSNDGTDPFDFFADPGVGPHGELYVSWHDTNNGTILVDRDLDGLFASRNTFGTDVTVAMLNDSLLFTGVPAQRRRGIFTGPVLDVDRNNGRVYIVYTDTTATKNLPDTDIFLVSSNNQGTNWSPSPVAVEQSTGTDFLPWIDVDQTTGSVNVIYYTTDGDVSTGNDDVNVRVRTSTDGGASFPVAQSVNLSTATSNAGASNYVGDFLEYIGLAVLDGTIHGLWSDNRGMASDLEAFTASAATTSAGNVLRVTGDDNDETDDLISISLSTVNSDFLEVFVNGERQFTGLSASISSIEAFGLAGEDILKSPASDDLLDGGDGDDKLFAGDGNDTLLGGDGDDTLLGEAGNDKLEGNDDDDKLFGGDGNDKLDGGEDDDKLFAGDGDDTLIGGDGDDTLLGEAGNDKLDGGKDDDKLSAGDGNDTLIGGEGDDTLVGEAGNDKLDGGKDDDKLSAGDGNDTLIGGEGDDTLVGEAGNDKLDGGEDDDKLSGGDGNDTLIGGNDDDTLLGGSSQDRLFGDAGNDKLKGNDGDDKLFGGDGDDKLFGGQGQDQLFGDAGDDLLYGGTGDNTMTGGAGNDTFVLSTEGKNNIIDFQDGQDLLGLTGGLTFDSLSIFGQNNGTFINTSNNQPLTFLANVNPNLLTADDFITV